MSENKALQKQESQAVFAVSINDMETQIAEMNEFIGRCLKPSESGKADGDYGTIPGCGDKPTLLQPGADKLCRLFGYAPDFEIIESSQSDTFIRYVVKCILKNRQGEFIAAGLGAGNSRESKFSKALNKIDTVVEWKATEEQKRTGRKVERVAQKTGKKYIAYEVALTLPAYELDNNILKITRKRSYIAAVISATRLHHRFTQDIEDMDRGVISGKGKHIEEAEAEVIEETSPTETALASANHYQDLIASLKDCKSVAEVEAWKEKYGAAVKTLPENLQKDFFALATRYKKTLPEAVR